MVASSSAGFFSSMTPRGRPLTNRTTSGLRVFRSSATVNWLTAQPVVVDGFVEIDDPSQVSAHASIRIPIFNLHTIYQHTVKGAVAGFEGRAFGPGQLAIGVVQCRRGQAGVQFGEGVPQPSPQNPLA